MIIKLSDIIDHERFKWSRSHAEVKDNFVDIINDLTGVLPNHSSSSRIYSSSWKLTQKIKQTKKGYTFLSVFRTKNRKWLEDFVIDDFPTDQAEGQVLIS